MANGLHAATAQQQPAQLEVQQEHPEGGIHTSSIDSSWLTSSADLQSSPSTLCLSCQQLRMLLMERELECAVQAAQLNQVVEERDLLTLHNQSLLHIVAQEAALNL
jgi:hypothetical protein